uniref:MICOS complex subunit MIC10 n=1 Tax=Soboliphyme baturini TaxID=241478 RepID=A0A183J384_9BILA
LVTSSSFLEFSSADVEPLRPRLSEFDEQILITDILLLVSVPKQLPLPLIPQATIQPSPAAPTAPPLQPMPPAPTFSSSIPTMPEYNRTLAFENQHKYQTTDGAFPPYANMPCVCLGQEVTGHNLQRRYCWHRLRILELRQSCPMPIPDHSPIPGHKTHKSSLLKGVVAGAAAGIGAYALSKLIYPSYGLGFGSGHGLMKNLYERRWHDPSGQEWSHKWHKGWDNKGWGSSDSSSSESED